MSEQLPAGKNQSVSGLDIAVELDAVPAADTVSGSPQQGVTELGAIGDAKVGIWELRDGVVTDTEIDELFVVLSGGATIEFLSADVDGADVDGADADSADADSTDADDSASEIVTETVKVGVGDVMRLVAGSRTRWTVSGHIRKVYISAE